MGPANDGERRREARSRDLVEPRRPASLGPWATRWQLRAARLRELDAELAADPTRVALLLQRAEVLDALGLREEALAAFAAVLAREPAHYAAQMRFGALLAAAGDATAAGTVFREAAARHPDVAAPHACLGTLLLDAGETAAARDAFTAAVRLDPAAAESQRGLAVILEREGDASAAARIWRDAFPNGSIEEMPVRGAAAPVRVLVLTSALGGNVPLQHVLDDRVFAVATLLVESAPPSIELPPHDVAFNAIGDADRCDDALERAAAVLARSDARCINPPAAIRRTARVANARRLAELSDVVAPKAATFARAALCDSEAPARLAAAGFSWPVLLRSPGYHTGEHFVRVDGPDDLGAAVAQLPGTALLALEFLDTRRPDGIVCKYRVMTIGGALYPLHAALSRDWKVHYFSAAMAERADYRAEEAAFLAEMAQTLGPRATAALARVAQALELDYGGIDFSVDAAGRLVVFEANATMLIRPPEAGPRWEYRRPAIRKALDAARDLLLHS